MKAASHSDRSIRWIVVSSVLHWDLWSAIAVGMSVAIASSTIDLDPKRGWMVPLLVLSVGVLSAALQQWTSVRSKLSGSAYGELVRIADESEIEVKMPYQIAIWTAMASVVCAVPATLFIEGINWRWGQSVFLAAVSLFATWSLLALISIIALTLKHDRHVAEVESMREKTEAMQRRALIERDLGAEA